MAAAGGIALHPPYGNQLGRPSYEVCIRCAFEFGNDDDPGTAPGVSFEEYRVEWIARGRPWLGEEYKEKYRSRPRTPRPIIIRALPPGRLEASRAAGGSTSAGLDRRDAILSMNRALWDVVTPNLRTVAMQVVGMKVSARFVYDTPITEEILELVDEADTQALADLPDGSRTDFTAEFLPPHLPRDLHDGETWLYLRHEQRAT